ncbi:MAG: bifunctional ornithine acetyltransferase/N-acetylglutamate synthase [Rhodospirillaceae bacterium]|nr:bifunctional ornithine acetyltransferase/N-acetylglutamate synthase [Rhodospirillaceae bacterium]
MDLKKSPLAPKNFPRMPGITGVSSSTSLSGLKYKGRPDLLLVKLKSNTSIAGVLTKTAVPGCPVIWCRDKLQKGKAQALFVNSGNANVFTGSEGQTAVKEIAKAVSAALKCPVNSVFMASTGVIGEKLNHKKIITKIPKMADKLREGRWNKAATAITTTDTFPKGAYEVAFIGNKKIRIAGIAKGSGMIAPDMATMLSFIFTDANISSDILQTLLSRNVQNTFNAITVDSDASTSDTLLLFATGAAKSMVPMSADDPILKDFESALQSVMLNLAKQIVCDGEGAQKLIQVDVTGATSKKSAHKIGLAIANSPLVKTAIAGGDANWGRVVMAVGKSGEKADANNISVCFGKTTIAEKGAVVEGYDEAPVTEHLQGREIHLAVDVGLGNGKSTVWTCDLTHGYIQINADYRS